MAKFVKCKECGNNTWRRYIAEEIVKIKETKTDGYLDIDTNDNIDETYKFVYMCNKCNCEMDY